MDVFSYTISKVFSSGGNIHYVLPHFQREYRWERKNWDVLLDDAFQIYDSFGKNDTVPEHFLGAMVVLSDGSIGLDVAVHKLVDGQQRLTTISLLLCAFARLIAPSHPKFARSIKSYLFNAHEENNARFKLLPTLKNGDRAAFQAVLDDKPLPVHQSRIPQAFEYFYKTLKARFDADDLDVERFFKVLTQAMQVVCIRLDANENAYQIFESLNNKAEPLKQSDLIRNYIAMRLSSDKQEQVFHQHWQPIEDLLDDNETVTRSAGELTAFLRHYDAMKTGVLPSEKNVYARFRDEMQRVGQQQDLIEELATLRRFATYYDQFLRFDRIPQPTLLTAFKRVESFDSTTAFPLFLAIADHYDREVISLEEYVESCKIVENYLVRRFLIDAPTNFLNKMFAAAPRSLDWQNFLPSLRSHLSAQKYPSDIRIHQVFPGRALYGKTSTQQRLITIFEAVNLRLYRGSDVFNILKNAPTIEHILPQKLSDWWTKSLGAEAETIADEWKHTVGNLTIVTQGYNSALSNDSFPEKRAKLIAHGLKFNSEYFSRPIENWDAAAIQARAAWLTDLILEVWPSLAPVSTNSDWSNAGKPVALHLDGVIIAVSSWRDVLRQIAKYVQEGAVDFAILENRMSGAIRQAHFNNAQFDFQNGYFLNINLSGHDTHQMCERLLKAADLGDVEWEVELSE